jgi:hypothetical protein
LIYAVGFFLLSFDFAVENVGTLLFGCSFDKSMEEKEKRGLGDVPMMLGERV